MTCVEIAAAAAAAVAVGALVADLSAVVQNAAGAQSESFVEAAGPKMTEFAVVADVVVDIAAADVLLAAVADDDAVVVAVDDDVVVSVAAAVLVAVTAAAAMYTG